MLRKSLLTTRFTTILVALLLACLLMPADASAKDRKAKKAEEESEVELEDLEASPIPDSNVQKCYLGIEFLSSPYHAILLRVDVEGDSMALFGAGEKVVGKFPEGMRKITITAIRSNGKDAGSEKLTVELRPYSYTKLVIDEVPGKKEKNLRLRVKVLDNEETVRTRTLNL